MRLWPVFLAVPCFVAACDETNHVIVTPAEEAAGEESPAPEAEPSTEAGPRDAGADASRKDSGPSTPPKPTGAWTMESAANEVLIKGGTSVTGIDADPLTPRRLVLKLQGAAGVPGGGKQLALPWSSGTFGTVLQWSAGGDAQFVHNGNGGGFAPNGDYYEFIAFHSGRVPVQVGVRTGTAWSWKEVQAPFFGSWPPRAIRIMPGATPRVFLQTDGELLEISTTDFMPPVTKLGGGSGTMVFEADGTTYLRLGVEGFVRCTLATAACAPIVSTGIGANETLSGVEGDLYHARILVGAYDAATSTFRYYTSSDGAATFQPLGIPSPTRTRMLSVPGQPGTFVTVVPPTNASPGGIEITRDSGQTWNDIAPPPTNITDISGLAVDAAGTLFLVRSGTLFSQKL